MESVYDTENEMKEITSEDYEANMKGMNGVDAESDAKGINVDDVLGELRDILKDKYTESESSEDEEIKEAFRDLEGPNGIPLGGDVTTNDYGIQGDVTANGYNKTDEEKMVESGLAKSPPTSPSYNPVHDRPIFFKTSIKKDPGSKLHDQLVKELGSVLKKRVIEKDPDAKVEEGKKDVHLVADSEERRQISADKPVGKILQNKVLLANLENHLKRSLHKINIKQRSSLHDADLDSDKTDPVLELQNAAKSLKHHEVKRDETGARFESSEFSIVAKSLKHVSLSKGQKIIASHVGSASQKSEKELPVFNLPQSSSKELSKTDSIAKTELTVFSWSPSQSSTNDLSKTDSIPKTEKKKKKSNFFKRRFSKDKSKGKSIEYTTREGKHVTYIHIYGKIGKNKTFWSKLN